MTEILLKMALNTLKKQTNHLQYYAYLDDVLYFVTKQPIENINEAVIKPAATHRIWPAIYIFF
jgi:hypothetical protein